MRVMTPLRLSIAAPCSERFADMRGDERARFCDKCQKPVHDLSARTEQEVQALLRERAGQRLCVRYRKDADGGVRFKVALLATAMSVAACGALTTDSPAVTGEQGAIACANPVMAEAGANDELLQGDIATPSDDQLDPR